MPKVNTESAESTENGEPKVPKEGKVSISLDLPAPPSVNRTRRYNWAHRAVHQGWLELAYRHVMAQPKQQPIVGRYAVRIVMKEGLKMDLDNGVKALLDFLHKIELVTDDAPAFLREFTVAWGDAPEGCRITATPCS